MSMSILIRGRFRIHFARADDQGADPGDQGPAEVRLEDEGAYVIWGSDTKHTWEALADTVILTVRWGDLGDKVTRKHGAPPGWERPPIEE